MAKSEILLEAGTNEVELLEIYLDELEDGQIKRRSFGLNVAKVKKIFKSSAMKNFSGGQDRTNFDASGDRPPQHELVLGMFEFMDRVIPLIDLSRWLEFNIIDQGEKYVVCTEFNEVISAFLISSVNRIHRISWSELEPLDENMVRFAGETVIGTVKLTNPDRIMQVLDLERLIGEINPSAAWQDDEAIEEYGAQVYSALSCDDSLSMRNAVNKALNKGGFYVTTFTNGRDAWDHLQKLRIKADREKRSILDYMQVVVTDIEMPMMDGLTLTRKIKEDRVLKDLPVYLFSSIITDELRHKGESVGATGQYSKPQMAQLIEEARNKAAELSGNQGNGAGNGIVKSF